MPKNAFLYAYDLMHAWGIRRKHRLYQLHKTPVAALLPVSR